MSGIDDLLRAVFARGVRIVAGYDDVRPFLAPVLPASEAALRELPVVERIASIALLKRYEQLQDIVAQLGRLMIAWEGERTDRLSRRDLANWLERFGAVDDADEFIAASELRNRLVHDYPLDEDEQAQRVNASWAGFPALIAMVEALRQHMISREFDFDGQ